MNHQVIPDNDHKQLYDPEHRGQSDCSQTEVYLKYKQGVEEWINERLHPAARYIFSRIEEDGINKKRRFNWLKFFTFISLYFGYIIISSLVYKYVHFLFGFVFSFATLGSTLWMMGIKPLDNWLDHFWK